MKTLEKDQELLVYLEGRIDTSNSAAWETELMKVFEEKELLLR